MVVVVEEQLTPAKLPCILKKQLCKMDDDIEICVQFFYKTILAIETFYGQNTFSVMLLG